MVEHPGERRAHRRWPVALAATLSPGEPPRLPCSIRDVSWGGLFLEGAGARRPPAPGRRWRAGDAVDIVGRLSDDGGGFRARGRVCRAQGGGLGIALDEVSTSYVIMMQRLTSEWRR